MISEAKVKELMREVFEGGSKPDIQHKPHRYTGYHGRHNRSPASKRSASRHR